MTNINKNSLEPIKEYEKISNLELIKTKYKTYDNIVNELNNIDHNIIKNYC